MRTRIYMERCIEIWETAGDSKIGFATAWYNLRMQTNETQ